MSDLQKASKAVAWSAVKGWGAQLIGLVVFTLLARFLSPEEFGLVALALVFIAFTQMFVDQGLSVAIIQYTNPTDGHLSTAFWTNVCAGIVLMSVSFLSAELVSEIFRQPELENVLKWLSTVLFLNSLVSVQAALFRKSLRFRPVAISTISSSTVGGFVGVLMAYSGYGVWSLVAQQLIQSTLQILILWSISSWRPTLYWNIGQLKELFSYSANVLGINLFEFFNRYSDNLLIGYYLGPTALGYYSLAYKFYQTLTKLFGGLANEVAFSSYSSFQHDIPRVRQAFYTSTQMVSFVTFPLFIGAALLTPEIFSLLLGDKWQDSIVVFQILMAVALIESVLYFNGSVMMSLGKPHWRLKLNMLNAAVNIVGFYIAVHWGIEYVALAYVLRTYLLSPIPLYCVKTLINISFKKYLIGLARPLFCSAIMILPVFFLKPYFDGLFSEIMIVFLCVGTCALLYALCSHVIMAEMMVLFKNSVFSVFSKKSK